MATLQQTKRVRWMLTTISEALLYSYTEGHRQNLIDEFQKIEQNVQMITDFLNGVGPSKILVYYQVQEMNGNDDINSEPTLFVTTGDSDKLKEKGIFFLRNIPAGRKVNQQEPNDNDVIFGEVTPNVLVQINKIMEYVYQPLMDQLYEEKREWGQCEDESVQEFKQLTQKFSKELSDSVKSMTNEKDQFTLDPEMMQKFTSSAQDSDKIQYFEILFTKWIGQINTMLNDDSDQKKEQPDAGPKVELEYWKQRMQKITGWCEQLRSPDFTLVKQTLQKHRQHEGQRQKGEENISKLMMDYNRLDLLLTDKLNEAKDNVKYLTTLEKFIDPLYNGTPQQIIETLPALMNAIKMIHTIARFYNTADKMTGLFMKITNQMINNCKKRILAPEGKNEAIWLKDPQQLIENLGACMKLNKEYKECYNKTKDKIAEMPKGKAFDFSETQIFGKFDQFCRRVLKLIEIFTTIQQFQSLAQQNLEGMEELTEKFKKIIEDFKSKKHQLLDFQVAKFDRDYVEFNVKISHLDTDLQNFIDNNFNRFRNIEYSLKLLHKFENTLKRDTLKHNLTSKYNAILHNYATDLEGIQRTFSDQRNNPPIVRNMPSEAGKIIWARHLFKKITGPIKLFKENAMNLTEIRKYYGSYNTLGKQLTVYEMWFFQSWCSEIEKAKAALQATLIVRHEENKKLYVNFDLEILQLIRESKCIDRELGEIPESAKIILLQEEKFKMYYNELQYVLKEYERIISKIKPINKTLLGPHVEDLELKLRPGMVTLTWTSMNIDSYLQHVHQGLNKMEQLIISANDIIENRIENNLKLVSKIILVKLPNSSKPLTLEDFVKIQEDYIESKTGFLVSKNIEVECAVDDLLNIILMYPLDPHVDPVLPEESKKIKRYYFWYLYQALLNSTQNSLNNMKYRVCGKKEPSYGQSSDSSTELKPFFQVHIDLAGKDGKEVLLSPSLDEIQKAINKAATAVLRCSKKLYNWEQSDKKAEKASFYEMIAQDKEIVKVILLLTGSIQGTRNKVNEFLIQFNKYVWLWEEIIAERLKAFQQSNPTLTNYEEELKKFQKIEEEIDRIPDDCIIGAMELKTEKIKVRLKNFAKEWKLKYAEHLHKKAKDQLDSLTEQTKNFDTKLNRIVKDIDSLGNVMETLEDIRKKEAEIDMEFNPVTEMYQLLDNYMQGSFDKDEQDSRSMLKRNWDELIKKAKLKQKELQHKQSIHFKNLKESVKKFSKEVKDFRKDYEENGPMVINIQPKEAMERLRRFEDEYQVKDKFYRINKQGEDLFGLTNQKYPELEKTEAELRNLKKLYHLYNEVIESINKWQELAWPDVTVGSLNEMEEYILKYGDMCGRLPRDLKEWNAYKELKTRIEDLKLVLPIIRELKKESIKPRHWDKIIEITKVELNYKQEDNFYLSQLFGAHLLDFVEDITDVTDGADKQLKIERTLKEIQETWANIEFKFSKWGKTRDYECILKGEEVGEIQEKLDEDSMSLTTLNAQRHVAPFRPQVEEQINIFFQVQDTLERWVKVQVLWTSLEAVFMSGDIAKQMPAEAKKFQGIDKKWLKLMEKAIETKKVIQCCQNDMLNDFLPDLQDDLEICQKSLEQYLEGKRKCFPRFYFVSNPALLKILSQGSEPTSIQDDFEKLFDAISKVTFDKNPDKKGSQEKIIKAITQKMGSNEETVDLDKFVKCEGNIEAWLLSLEKSMQETIKEKIKLSCVASINMADTQLEDFVKASISQVALLGIQFVWTAKMTEALSKTGKNEKSLMEQKKKEIAEILKKLTAMCLEEITSVIIRTKIETLITIMVHQKDLTFELKCKDVNEFDWLKQTRIYWKDELDTCVVSITDWDQPYSYEFLGAKERLCITPLTDRCYISLAQASNMYYGGAPAGPAGTGKTETVKDLGRTLGIFVVVTNCSDQHRYKDMAKIFKGLCQSGLWGCFDEFNRIHLDVLSVVAMQVLAIQAAKKSHQIKFMFPEEPNPIDLVDSVGYFITMNPGYAGRQELPENLKVLFRGVSMMVPDREIIIKVKLASQGFLGIDFLSKKFDMLYKLCEQQLSKQRHYDFGLRNILSVLRTAGNTKRQEQGKDEEMLLMRSLRDMNWSKLVADDIPLFNSLLLDIFPKFPVDKVEKKLYPEVEKAIKKQFSEKYKNLVKTDSIFLKIIQVHETALVRHGFMLVGPTGAGKTTILNILTDALGEQGTPYKIQKINPKAITAEEMYGVKSDISDDWTPGIFSTIWSKSNQRSSKFNTWITFDGPVDTIWIESLNTVLDDNKILTLANGDRIPMTENCKLVFEVENLNNASPATVSRCGQIFISSSDLGVEPIVEGYAKSRSKAEEAEKLRNLFNKYFKKFDIVETVLKRCKAPVMEISDVIMISNTLNLLSGILEPFVEQNKVLSEQEYEKIFLYAMTWAMGGVYEVADRQIFHDFLWEKGCPIPSKGKESETLFDYYIYVSPSGQIDWRYCQPFEWKPPTKELQFSQILMPTVDSFRVEKLLNYTLNQPKFNLCQKATLLLGGAGTAKTSSVLMYADKFQADKMLFKRVNFSSATKPSQFQENIETECDFKVGRDFAPPGNKNMTVFIDDMSMPFINKWGDQETLEIVRQLIETGGFYMLDKTQRGTFKTIKNLQYIGAMMHPGGGRNDIPNRSKRQFFIFNMILPMSVEGIFGPIIQHVFKSSKFSQEFSKIVETLPSATVKLWTKVKNTLLPTPNKFHYLFNMRELSRIFKGVLFCKKDVLSTCTQVQGTMKSELFLVGLWRHECERVFVDKLVNYKDKDTVINYINEISLDSFNQLESEIQENFNREKTLYFLDFLREDQINEEGIVEVAGERVYEAIASMDKLKARCNQCLDLYNTQFPSKKMNLVLFDDAVKHLLRISRAIVMPRSSALLVGVGGSGKQSLTRLAAQIAKNKVFQIVVTKSYQEKDFKEDLKTLYDQAGHLGQSVTFIMTDSEVKKEDFLEFINMILSTGEVPGLIAKDDREIWLGDITQEYIKQRGSSNVDPTQRELYSFFVDRLRDNLHIVLCFSPVGQKFRDRARKFPALFNECIIDWFLPWPEEALVSVANTFITKFEQLDTTKEIKKELMKHMGNVHLLVQQACDLYFQKMRRQVFITPKSYLSYLNSYKQFYIEKYMELDVQEKSYKVGIQKIHEASQAIAELEVDLKKEDAKLKEATEKVEALLENLGKESHKVKIKKDQVEQESAECQAKAAEIQIQKDDAQKDLQAAMPALIRAQKAVDSLNKNDVNEMKANKKPLDIIKYIMDVICIFFQTRVGPIVIEEKLVKFEKKEEKKILFMKDSWEEGGAPCLADMKFMDKLKLFEKDCITDETIELLEPYLQQKDLGWFTDDKAAAASQAAAGILRWGFAIAEYHQKSKIVKPKQANLILQEGRLKKAEAELKKAKDELTEIEKQQQVLKDQCSKQMADKQLLEDKANKTKKKITTAKTLITSLSEEKDRWSVGANEIGDRKKKLVGNISLATAFISYCGPFNAEFRQLLQNDFFINDMKKKQIPVDSNLNLTSFLVNDAIIGDWNMQGLPKDDLSIQNGIMVTNSTRYCLFIDPQGQGYGWIKNKQREFMDDFSITTLNNPKFKDRYLKPCMENGRTLIVEGIENEVDPMLDPVLEKQIEKRGRTEFIKVGDLEMEIDKNFQLYLTCRLPNPSFSPELSAKTTIINFTVTQGGLEQQLLGIVLSKEQKALEESLTTLLKEVNDNKKDLQQLDKDLLKRLTESSKNLLEDTELMEVLNNTKTQSKEVKVKLADADIKTKEINEKREQYRPIAVRGSALYFSMIELQQVNWMYNSSLEQFLTLFNYSIENSERAQIPNKRVEIIIKYLTFHVYKYINRGLFEKDKITFILLVCFKILQTAQKITGMDISVFLKAGAEIDSKSEKQKPATYSFMTDKAWLNIIALSRHTFSNEGYPFFRELPELIQRNEAIWKAWIEKNDPENHQIPDYAERINNEKEIGALVKLCLIRSVREDRTLVAATQFIFEILGGEFTKPLSYPIEEIWEESTNEEPILFLLSAGADPQSAIDELAKKKKKYPYEKVSMGEGQERIAKIELEKGFISGSWVILQNCHLGLEFMGQLLGLIESADVVHDDFRLWITCEPHNKFPLSLLQRAIKVTNEPPKGLKAGLHKTFTTIINQDFLDKLDTSNWKQLIFTLCFMHSIVQERRKFGPLGWCVPYEFNNSDLEASLTYVEKYLSNLMSGPQIGSTASLPVNTNTLKYMICEVQYGGRVTDDLDRELLTTFGDFYLKEGIFGTEHTFQEAPVEGLGAKEKFKYKIPQNPNSEIAKYREYIDTVPQQDSPEVFGLHISADLTFRLKESIEMINTIMETRPKDSNSGAGKSREELVQDKAKDILSKLPPDYKIPDVREQIKKLQGPRGMTEKGFQVPMNVFLFQEIQRMQMILTIVRKSLQDVINAIDGTIIMTPNIVEMIDAISDAKVPNLWVYDATGAEISWLYPNLGGWINSLSIRNAQLNTWLKEQHRPNTFFLGGFFNPQGFLTAMKQEVTRIKAAASKADPHSKDAWSLDDVIYQTTVKDKEYENIKDRDSLDGVFIQGLWLEGCQWKTRTNSLEDAEAKKNIWPLPILHVTAVPKKKSHDTEKMSSSYNCPVYKYPKRTDKYLIFRVFLNCDSAANQGPQKWKLRGVALLCQTE